MYDQDVAVRFALLSDRRTAAIARLNAAASPEQTVDARRDLSAVFDATDALAVELYGPGADLIVSNGVAHVQRPGDTEHRIVWTDASGVIELR